MQGVGAEGAAGRVVHRGVHRRGFCQLHPVPLLVRQLHHPAGGKHHKQRAVLVVGRIFTVGSTLAPFVSLCPSRLISSSKHGRSVALAGMAVESSTKLCRRVPLEDNPTPSACHMVPVPPPAECVSSRRQGSQAAQQTRRPGHQPTCPQLPLIPPCTCPHSRELLGVHVIQPPPAHVGHGQGEEEVEEQGGSEPHAYVPELRGS